MKHLLIGVLLAPLLALADEAGPPAREALAPLEQPGQPGFGDCAAYYFLAARGHPATEYDALYTAGEFSMNSATILHGKGEGAKQMEVASGRMMTEMDQNWLHIGILDKRYASSCAALLRNAGYGAP